MSLRHRPGRSFGARAQQRGVDVLMGKKAITGGQIVAARALTQISLAKLAARAEVDISVLADIESGRTVAVQSDPSLARIRKALEQFGAVFIPERQGAGIGVRLKFGSDQVRAIGRWEDEGGAAADDDVP